MKDRAKLCIEYGRLDRLSSGGGAEFEEFEILCLQAYHLIIVCFAQKQNTDPLILFNIYIQGYSLQFRCSQSTF